MNRTLLMIAMFCSASTFAQSPVIDNATIDNSGAQYQGNVGVNQAAGDLQQQANARAFAIARSSIQGDSFSHGNGALGVNQSAGASNQQANALRISTSEQPQSIDDSVLMQQNVTLLYNSDPTDSAPGYRQVTTSDQAFTGSRGVIQLNQSAGVGNRMANTLSVRVVD